jgi:hypothetical protein
METLLHLLKGSLGTGILAMPNAFYRAGYVLGVTGTLFIGVVCTYCIHQLVSGPHTLLTSAQKVTFLGIRQSSGSDVDNYVIVRNLIDYPHWSRD